jgi:hypothetical protein
LDVLARFAAAIVTFGASLVVVLGQSALPPPTSPESAAREGANYPKQMITAEQPGYSAAVGPIDRRCVEAEGLATARSGEWVAGPFDRYYGIMGGGRKVWFAPRTGTVHPPMQLRASKIGAPDVTFAWASPAGTTVNDGDAFLFPAALRFPQAGRWLVVVTSGQNWGCFLLDEIDPA